MKKANLTDKHKNEQIDLIQSLTDGSIQFVLSNNGFDDKTKIKLLSHLESERTRFLKEVEDGTFEHQKEEYLPVVSKKPSEFTRLKMEISSQMDMFWENKGANVKDDSAKVVMTKQDLNELYFQLTERLERTMYTNG